MGQQNEGEMSDSSKPPPDPLAQSSDAWERARAAKAQSSQAIAIATEARDGVKRIEVRQLEDRAEFRATIGVSPDPARKIEGAGLLGGVALVLDRLETIEATNKAAAASRAWWTALGRGVLVGLTAIATAIGVIKAVTGK